MKKYELMFILKAEDSEAARNKEIEKIKALLLAEKCENVAVNIWGVKKYAYPINFKNEGFYVLINFEANTTVPAKIIAALKVNENVVRYMVANQVAPSAQKAAPTAAVEKTIEEDEELKD